MRLHDSCDSVVQLVARLLGVAVIAGVAGACASTSDGPSASAAPTPGLFGGDDANKNVVTVASDSSLTAPIGDYCPPLEIRPGTEAVVIYERNHEDDPNFVRFQGSITQTARECHTVGADTLSIKVGIAGRLTAGPKGGPGKFNLPLRIAVIKQHGGNVFYSEVSKVEVSIAAPEFAADFSHVVDNVSFQVTPADRDLIVYVGYDEGKPKPKPKPTG
jgi:hypothetical protein